MESHLVTFDNKIAATAVIAAEERYYNPPFKFVDQQWIVIIGSNAYFISYLDSPIDDFDSPSHTMIRDHFIKSIKCLKDSSATTAKIIKTFTITLWQTLPFQCKHRMIKAMIQQKLIIIK